MKEQEFLGGPSPAEVAIAGSIAGDAAPHAAPTHTPGPWVYDGEYIWSEPDERYVANPRTEDMRFAHEAEIQANAHLIAAAPTMKEALEAIQSQCAGHADEFSCSVYAIARAAIAKAEGKV